MMKKTEKIRYDGAKPLMVLPYVVATSAAMMYTICRDYMLICTLIMGALSCAVYMLIYRYRKKPVTVAGLVLVMAALGGAAVIMTGPIFGEDGFMDFVFTASTFFDVKYAAAAIALFSVIIGFMVCFFSVFMPQVCLLMLVAYIPMILSSRTGGGLPLWISAPMFGALILALLGSARRCQPSDVAVFRDRAGEKQRIAAALCLAVLSAAIAAALPKSAKTPMGDYLDTVLTGENGYYRGNERLSNFASRSTVNKGDNTAGNNLLFTVQTEAPMLIDRWVFDKYNGSEGWQHLEDYNTGYAGWEDYEAATRPAELSNALRKAAKDGGLEAYGQLAELPRTLTDTQYMFIRVMDGSSTKVVLHPATTIEVEFTDYNGAIFRTQKGELFTDNNIQNAQYLISYHAENVSDEFANAMGLLDFEQLLYDAAACGAIDNLTYNAFSEEYKRARQYRENTAQTDAVSDELRQLALEITADCTTDYEKARAIEQWFAGEGFVYDMDFVPRRSDADYFVFDSKRGICSDYATAVTLLARAAGLAARYTEGFVLKPERLDENGVYNVTSADTHAYTQIYIAGCGWVSFDATAYVSREENGELTVAQIIALIVACVATVVVIVLAVIFRRRLEWALFSLTYPLRSEESAVKALSKRMREVAARMAGKKASCMSMGEAEEIIAGRLHMGEQAGELRRAADELLYSAGAAAGFDKKRLHRCMADILRKKRRMKR